MKTDKIEQIKALIKNKKEVVLYLSILISVLSVMGITSYFIHNNTKDSMSTETWEANSYRVVINNIDVGLVSTKSDGEQLVKDALERLTQELGYDPETTPEVRYYEEYSEDKVETPTEDVIAAAKDAIKEGLDVIKEKAYVMKIGEDFVIALKTKEEVEAVLEKVQSLYVSENVVTDIELAVDPNNGLVETPQVILKEDLSEDRQLTTASNNKELTADDIYVEEDAVFDPEYEGETIDVDFEEDVLVVESYVDSETIVSVEEATELVTKENQEPKTYIVKEGDTPSTIAAANNMKLEELYALNEGLKDQKYIHIGDELIIMVPEPELSVTTKEKVIYKTPIPRGTTYVENPDKYVGSNVVIDNGYDGEMQVTAILTKVNGKETDREIIDETVAKEPKNRVVQKGTKPLPAKGATGSYVPPLESYTITSYYGYRWGGFHYGVDFAAPTGTTVRASDGGVVIFAGWRSGYGYLVIIDHGNGVTTRYGHNSSISVSVGQQVSQYQEIAKVGSTGNSTGPHVHFEIRFDGVAADPLKYLEYY